MTKTLICPDVSAFQRPLDSTYTRDFVIFRGTFGGDYLDPEFLANANEVKRLYDAGRIAGALIYTVYTDDPVRSQFDFLWKAIGPRIPAWLTGIMIDVETWRGQRYELSGNHSGRINYLYGLHAHRMRAWSSVIAYGNESDLAELYPGRDKRCRVILASYGSHIAVTKVRGAIGQQYTDGKARWGVPKIGGRALPLASAPFGHCDHNVFPGHPDGTSLVRLLRPQQLADRTPRPTPRAAVVKQAPRRPRVATSVAVKPVAVKPVPAKPVAVKPVPAKHVAAPPAVAPPAAVAPAALSGTGLPSWDGKYVLAMRDDGSLEIRHEGIHYATLKGTV